MPAPPVRPICRCHTIEELAAHLEDIYTATRAARARRRPMRCWPPARRSRNRSLAVVPRSRTHPDESRLPCRPRLPERLHRPGRRSPVRVAAAASQPVVCRRRDRHARARRRRRHRDLQHRRHGAAAPASLPPAGAARRDLGIERREGAAEGTAVPGQLHGLPRRQRRVHRRGGLVAARDQSRRSPAASRSA